MVQLFCENDVALPSYEALYNDLINSLTTRVADLQLFITCAKRPELQICNFFTINT